MKNKKLKYLVIPHIILLLSTASFSQNNKTTADNQRNVLISKEMPALYTRLRNVIKKLKLKPGSDGKLKLLMGTGSLKDKMERMDYFYTKKAIITVSQDNLTRIEFEFYRFGLINTVKETKTIINTNPSSSDLKSLVVKYKSNTGTSENFKIIDLPRERSQQKIAKQYELYMIDLVHKLEIYKNQQDNANTYKMDQIINLDLK